MYYSIYETAKNSAGSAMDENEKYMQSLQARINQVRSEFEQLAVKVGEAFLSEGIINFTSALGKLFEGLAVVVDKFGALPLLLTTVGGAILLVNNRFRLFFANIATGKTSVALLASSFKSASTSALVASVSVNTLKTAIRGLGASLAIVAPMMAVGYALEFVINKMTEARERSEDLKRKMKEMTDSFAQDSSNVKSLASSIKAMEEDLSRGNVPEDKMADFTANLIEKRNELANLMPSLKKGEDEYGNAILYSNSIVETQISLVERQLELQKQIDEAQKKKEDIENIKALELEYQKLNKQIESQIALLQNRARHAGQNKFLMGERVLDDFNIQDLDEASRKLDELRVKRQEAMQDGNESLVKRLDDEIANFTEILYNAQLMQIEQEAIKQQIVAGSQQALLEILENNNAIDDSTKTMIANIAELLSTSELSTEEVKALVDEIAFSLRNDDAFKDSIQSYQEAIAQLERAREQFNKGEISEEAYVGQVKKASKEMDVVIAKINEMAKKRKIDIDSSAYKDFLQELGIVNDSMESIMQKALEVSESTGIPLAQAITQVKATSDSLSEVGEELENINGLLSVIGDQEGLKGMVEQADNLAHSYDVAKVILSQYTEEQIANTIAKEEANIKAMELGESTIELSYKERELIDAVRESDNAYNLLIETYGFLISAEDLSKLSKDEIMAKIREEIAHLDNLQVAMRASRDGKLTADQDAVVSSAQRAIAEINNINATIEALKKLDEAYNKMKSRMEGIMEVAKASGDDKMVDNAGKALMRLGYLQEKHVNEPLELANSNLKVQMNILGQTKGQIASIAQTAGSGGDYATRANKALNDNTKASKGNAAAKKANAKATKDGAKAEELAAFWVNKHKESIEELTLALKAQELVNSKLPKHTQEYKKGLQEVLKLEKLKLELMKAQERSLKQQIESGNIIKAGVQTESQMRASGSKVNVPAGNRNLSGWNGAITSRYGWRNLGQGNEHHSGIDIASPMGTKLDSNVSGKVLFAGMGTGDWSSLGNYVAVQAVDGLVHYYGHLQKVAVKAGDQVVKGQQLGNIGSTGRSSGPHLHYGVKRGSSWIDPTKVTMQSRGLQKIVGNVVTQAVQPVVKQVQGGIEAQIWSFLKNKGLSDNAVAGIMGNMQAESGYNPKAVNSIGASGLVQWLGGRKTNLMNFAKDKGTSWQDVQTQLDFLWKELNSSESRTLASLKQGDKLSAQQHAKNFENLFERSGGALMQRRQNAAVDALNKFKGVSGTGFVSSGLVDKDTASNLQDVNSAYSDLLKLQGDIIDQNEKIRELEEAILNVYFDAINAKRQEHAQTIAYEEEKMKSLDNTSERYVKTLAIQIRNLEAKQGYNLEEMNYIDYLIKNTKMSADRLAELSVRYKELQTEILATNNELQNFNSLVIDAELRHFEESIRRVTTEVDYLATIRGTLEQGSSQYNDITAQMIELTKQQAYQTQQYAIELQHLSSVRDISIEKLKEYNIQIHALNKQYWQLQGTIKDLEKAEEEFVKSSQEKIVNNLIEAYKQYLGEKRDMHMKSLEEERKREDELHKQRMDNLKDEMDRYQQYIDLKLREIDRDDESKTYEEAIADLKDERAEITRKLSLLAGNDSREAKYQRKKLQEELDKIDKSIEKTRYEREKQLAKQNYNDMLEVKQEEIKEKEKLETERHDTTVEKIDREREYWEKHYTDLLNDERKFAQLREQLLAGHYDALSTEFQAYIKEMEDTMPSLEDTLDGTMVAVGTSIRQNVIDNLKEALRLMTEFQQKQESPSGGGINQGGTSGGDIGSIETPKRATEGDFWVLAGKFMIDEVSQHSDDPVRLKSIQEKGYSHASQGRGMGSEIATNIGFEEALKNMSIEDQQRFADFIINNADDLVMTGEYQDLYKKMAWQILNRTAGFDTGGYTGNFSGGRLATLHSQELILDKKDTSTFGNVSQTLERMQSLISGVSNSIASVPETNYIFDSPVEITINGNTNQADIDELRRTISERDREMLLRAKGMRR